MAASVAFAVIWIALIPVFGLPKLDTGGESFRCAHGRMAPFLAWVVVCRCPWEVMPSSSAASKPADDSIHVCCHRASSGEVAENGFMFKAALRASVSTGIQPTCEDVEFDDIPTITADVMDQLESIGASDCAGLKTLLETAGMNCDTDLTVALAGLPAAADANTAAPISPEALAALTSFEFPDDITHLMQVCPATCGECGDGGSTSGEAGEHALQSKP